MSLQPTPRDDWTGPRRARPKTAYNRNGAPNQDYVQVGGWGDWYYAFIEMDLDSLPTTSTKIVDSELHLYQQMTIGVANNGKLEKVTSAWTESGVTSASNPSTDSIGMSWQSIPLDDWWVVDITDLTKDWISGSSSNYGVKIYGQYNSGSSYPQKHFITSDETVDVALRPKMVVTVVNSIPDSPSDLRVNSLYNPDALTTSDLDFQAKYLDEDYGDFATSYRIQVDDDSDFSSPVWDSGETSMSATAAGSVSPDIAYAGGSLASSTDYYWRIKFWDDGGAEGSYSSETAVFSLQ